MSDLQGDSEPPPDNETDVILQASNDPSLIGSLVTQFYRAEMDRVATWRTRLDQTTNWAVVVIAAILTWAFTSPDNPHYVLLIGMLALFAFLFIEAQRYQEYDAWRARIRLLQRNLFSEVFQLDELERSEWLSQLSQDLREPTVRLTLWKAIAHRLSRIYFPLFTILLAAWVARITVFEKNAPWSQNAGIAGVPGPLIVTVIFGIYLLALGLTIWSVMHAPKREFDEDIQGALLRGRS